MNEEPLRQLPIFLGVGILANSVLGEMDHLMLKYEQIFKYTFMEGWQVKSPFSPKIMTAWLSCKIESEQTPKHLFQVLEYLIDWNQGGKFHKNQTAYYHNCQAW